MTSPWDDGISQPTTLPELGVRLLDDGWSNASSWFALCEFAAQTPCNFVLTAGSYRLARPASLAASLLARNVLLTKVATAAISGLGCSERLEAHGFWPRPTSNAADVSSYLWKMARDCINLINLFLVEDEESLDWLLRACERELKKDAYSAVVGAAQERIRMALRNARDEALAALRHGASPQ